MKIVLLIFLTSFYHLQDVESSFSMSHNPQLVTIEEDHDVKHKHKPTKRYEPDWESLDSRPLPQWYDDAKIGR